MKIGNFKICILKQVILKCSKVCRDWKPVRDGRKIDFMGSWGLIERADIPSLRHLFIWCISNTCCVPGPEYILWFSLEQHLSLTSWADTQWLIKTLPFLKAWPIFASWLLTYSRDPTPTQYLIQVGGFLPQSTDLCLNCLPAYPWPPASSWSGFWILNILTGGF